MKRSRKCFSAVMLISSMALSVGLMGCPKKTLIIVPGEARVVRQLPNGNYEVTQGFLFERARYEAELEAKLEGCK